VDKTSGLRGQAPRRRVARKAQRMPFLSATVAFGILLATGGLLVAGSLILFTVFLRDDGPKIGGEHESMPLGWPISTDHIASPGARSEHRSR
jgi:hypothetical protein